MTTPITPPPTPDDKNKKTTTITPIVGTKTKDGIYVGGPPPPHTGPETLFAKSQVPTHYQKKQPHSAGFHPLKKSLFDSSLLPDRRPTLTDEMALDLMCASPEANERLHLIVATTRDSTLATVRALHELSTKLYADLPRITTGELDQTFEERLVQYWLAIMALTDQMHTAAENLEGIVRITPEWQLTRNNSDFCAKCQAAGDEPSLLDQGTGVCPKCQQKSAK